MDVASSSILLPATFAGAVAIGATVAIERFGGRLGGVLGSLPTTIVPASFGFWAHSANPTDYQQAIAVVPAAMLVNALFLWSWQLLPSRLPRATMGRSLAMMVVASLAVWGTGAAALYVLMQRLDTVSPLWIGVTGLLAIVVVGLLATARHVPAPRGKRRVGVAALLSRGVLAAIAIYGAITLSSLGSPMLAGMASVFPAIFLTAMVSLWVAQGAAVPLGAAGPLILGSTAVCLYALLSAVLVPSMGVGMGSLAAWIGAVGLGSVPAAAWLRRPIPVPADT